MRPINLIPSDERRSHGASTRTGPLAYIIVGSLAVLLIGVVMLVLTSNQISDRESEVAGLEAQKSAAASKADQLTSFTSFQALTEQRTQTIAGLADSRFDWPRVIRQLSLILPPRVYFDELTASAGGGVAGAEGEAAPIAGPSLQLEGCAPHQWVVAAFVSSLKDIDGVTRVGLKESKLTESTDSSDAGASYCDTHKVYAFQIVVAFDAAPPSPDGAEAIASSAAETAESTAEGTEESSEAESGEAPSGEEPAESSSSEETAASSTEAPPAG